MPQKLYCPMCKHLLISNYDLVVDDNVVFDMGKIKTTDKKVEVIKCYNCKRKIKYYIDKNS